MRSPDVIVAARRERGGDEPGALLLREDHRRLAGALDADRSDLGGLQGRQRVPGPVITRRLVVDPGAQRGDGGGEQSVQPCRPAHIRRRRHQITEPVITKASGSKNRKVNAIK